MSKQKQLAENLDFWDTPVTAVPISGGITNNNFKVNYKNNDYMVRIGDDILQHGIMRFNELNASVAGYKVGISPQIVHHQHGALVMEFITGKTLTAADIRTRQMLQRIVPVLKTCHNEMAQHIRAGLCFWVFQVNSAYAKTLKQLNSDYIAILPELIEKNTKLEHAVGAINLKFGHNDLLAGNFIDSGDKLWLIDWDYAGFNSPLFDLSGLATNNELPIEEEKWLLENYFETDVNDELWYKYSAMKCSSMLREALWSMVSEATSDIDFDYKQYSSDNILTFNKLYKQFLQL